MTEQELMNELQWKSVCKDDCYPPWPHTHDFDRDNLPQKMCKNCGNRMFLDARCYHNNPFKNLRMLVDCYECKKCQLTDQMQISLT